MCLLKINQRVLWAMAILVFTIFLINPQSVLSALFDSGSTGADGPFSPTVDTILALPADGVFNFTTVSIPAGVTVTFTPNTANTPVTFLATGDVTIDGDINLDGEDGANMGGTVFPVPLGSGGAGGPGGFAGGAGGLAPPWNNGSELFPGRGLGPGSGEWVNSSPYNGCSAAFGTSATTGNGMCSVSAVYGTPGLLPLIGGSGGGGGRANSGSQTTCTYGCNGGGGGGGAGAILIASSGTITINGVISANGGNGGNGYLAGGSGSGGGIRLIANVIGGSGSINSIGGIGSSNWKGGSGRIRLETPLLNFSGEFNPQASISTPGIVNFTLFPTLQITAVDGVPVPSGSTGTFLNPDITLPTTTDPNSISADLSATNIPVGTIVKVTVTGRNCNSFSGCSIGYNSPPLVGTDSNSTSTAIVALGSPWVSILRVEATFLIQTASNPFPIFAEGEKVEKIKVASIMGGASSIFLITKSGKEVPYQGALAK